MKKIELANLEEIPFNYSHIVFIESLGVLFGNENKGVSIPEIQNEKSIANQFYRPISKIYIEDEKK